MKLMNLLSLLLLLVTNITALSAQDISIKVKQGIAKLGGQSFTANSAAINLKSSDVLNIQPNALVIARQDVIIIELSANREYSYNHIVELIKKKKHTATSSVSTLAFKDPILKTNPTPLKGSSTRGFFEDQQPNFYYPYDNMLVYDAHNVFYIGGVDTRITSNVVLKNIQTNEIYYNGIPETGHFSVENLPEGDYEWTYTIKYYNATDEVTEDFKNTFKVPSEKERKELAKKVENFKKELKGFSPEMQHVLLLEYCIENGIYHKLH